MDERKTNITWSANDQYLKDFAAYFMQSQLTFRQCRANRNLVVDVFDYMHEVYRMEIPYLVAKELDGLSAEHDEIRKIVDNYSTSSDQYKAHNFGRIYYRMDAFFTKLTRIAVEKQFFPKKGTERTFNEKLDTMRQK
jgi:hypothetical protein